VWRRSNICKHCRTKNLHKMKEDSNVEVPRRTQEEVAGWGRIISQITKKLSRWRVERSFRHGAILSHPLDSPKPNVVPQNRSLFAGIFHRLVPMKCG
jgi:hypothetical protein